MEMHILYLKAPTGLKKQHAFSTVSSTSTAYKGAQSIYREPKKAQENTQANRIQFMYCTVCILKDHSSNSARGSFKITVKYQTFNKTKCSLHLCTFTSIDIKYQAQEPSQSQVIKLLEINLFEIITFATCLYEFCVLLMQCFQSVFKNETSFHF